MECYKNSNESSVFLKKVKQFQILSILETSKESSLAIPECLKKSKQRAMRAGSFSQKVQNELSVISASFSLKRKIIKIRLILSVGKEFVLNLGAFL